MCGQELPLQFGCEVFRRKDGKRESWMFTTSRIEVETRMLSDVTPKLESQRGFGKWNEIERIGVVEEEIRDQM